MISRPPLKLHRCRATDNGGNNYHRFIKGNVYTVHLLTYPDNTIDKEFSVVQGDFLDQKNKPHTGKYTILKTDCKKYLKLEPL